jgi:polyisoprenoid-binding protein YceI
MKQILSALALVALAACAPTALEKRAPAAAPAAPIAADIPAGAYTLDRAHASLIFRVDHLGFSRYTASFGRREAELQLDPANLSSARVVARIDPRSLTLENPPVGFLEALLGAQWLDAARYPEISFRSTGVALTGRNAARITGDLTLHGVTRPVTLAATFNGGYAGHPLDPNARIGFSARGAFKRSDFGIALGIPPAGSSMGVSDEVEVIIEAEFNGPPWTAPTQQIP